MNIVFTLCSNNYLAQAKTLGDSLLKYNPEYTFIIGLVDKKNPAIDYSFIKPHLVIPIEEISITGFDSLWRKYNLVELNTSVKASFFKYLVKQYPSVKQLFYFDPDIMVFDSLKTLEKECENAEILLTPHILTQIEFDDKWPTENAFLNYGLYNLGFLGLKVGDESTRFLNWWEERCLYLCFNKPCDGYYVDQLWINLVPLLFNNVSILKRMGYNAAPWNLHERKDITIKIGYYEMADRLPLVFFHFSNYNFRLPGQLSKYYTRYNFENCSELLPIYSAYHGLLLQNRIEVFSNVPCAYVPMRKIYMKQQRSLRMRIKKFVTFYLKQVLTAIRKSSIELPGKVS